MHVSQNRSEVFLSHALMKGGPVVEDRNPRIDSVTSTSVLDGIEVESFETD